MFRATGDDGVVDGIRTFSDDGGRIVGNGIRGLLAGAGHEVSGIYIDGAHARLRDNDVLGPAGHSPDALPSTGLNCPYSSTARALGNTIARFNTAIAGCRNDGNSL